MRSAKPNNQPQPQDFDEVKMDYSRKHQIDHRPTSAQGLNKHNQLAVELYRLAQAARLTVGRASVPRHCSAAAITARSYQSRSNAQRAEFDLFIQGQPQHFRPVAALANDLWPMWRSMRSSSTDGTLRP